MQTAYGIQIGGNGARKRETNEEAEPANAIMWSVDKNQAAQDAKDRTKNKAEERTRRGIAYGKGITPKQREPDHCQRSGCRQQE